MSYGPINEPLVIYLQYPTVICCVCNAVAPSQWGIPVDSGSGLIVSNDFVGEWGGLPACEECWRRHEGGAFVGTYPRF